MSGPDVCEHGNPGDRPCAQCVAAAPVAPEPSAQFTQQERRAIARVERDINEFDEDDRLAIRALLRAVDFRGVSVPASAARIQELASRVHVLEAALRPFAIASTRPVLYLHEAWGGPPSEDWPDDAVVELLTNAGDVRRARSVLGGETT